MKLIRDNIHNYVEDKNRVFQLERMNNASLVIVLKDKLEEFVTETNSKVAKKILSNYEKELQNFIQICPIEMLDKLENPITLNESKFKSA